VEPEEIRASNELVELPVLDHLARIEIRDLARDPCRPARRVPLPDGPYRGTSSAHRVENLLRLSAGGAHGTGPGDDDSRLAHRSVGPGLSGRGGEAGAVDTLRPTQRDAAVRAAEPERVGDRDSHRAPDRLSPHEVEVALRIGLAQVGVDRQLA